MNYNYDYGNYVMGYPDNSYNKMNYKGNQSSVTFMNNNSDNYLSNNNLDLVDPYVGLIRGNLFDNEYESYKNYKARDINVNNERDSLLGQIQMYKFGCTDLNLYLDVYPNDKRALQLLRQYIREEKELCNQYEMKYGPLTLDGISGNTYNWINNPWPWEVDR